MPLPSSLLNQLVLAAVFCIPFVGSDLRAQSQDRKIPVRFQNESGSTLIIRHHFGQDFRVSPRSFRDFRRIPPRQSVSFDSTVGRRWVVFETKTQRAVGMLTASWRQRQLIISEEDVRSIQGRSYRATFHNRTGKTVAAYRVYGSRALPHSLIGAGRSIRQSSWQNQCWEFREYDTNRKLRSFVAPASNAEVVIAREERVFRPFPVVVAKPEPAAVTEFLIDNRSSRPVLFWFESQRKKRRLEAHDFDTVPFTHGSTWFVMDAQTGRYIRCGEASSRKRRIQVTDDHCAPALAATVTVSVRNYYDEPVYAYPLLETEELPGIEILGNGSATLTSYVGQQWIFRAKADRRKIGAYTCAAEAPSAAIGRPSRFQRYEGKVDFTVENRWPTTVVDVYASHEDHMDLIGTVRPRARVVVKINAGENLVFMNRASGTPMASQRATLRKPYAILAPHAREEGIDTPATNPVDGDRP